MITHPAELSPYVGRFAPSPTGPLHLGSAVAAIASFLDARAGNGRWLVRIEDLDPPREQAGADKLILDAITSLGMQWDGDILYQSTRLNAYAAILQQLRQKRYIFPCACTRREIGARPYAGTCRNGLAPGRPERSLRFRVPDEVIAFEDVVLGFQQQHLKREVGDFNVRRADGLFSYHLAVVVDDAEQGITHIVRGVDLLDSTARQIALQRALAYPQPRYCHIPVVLGKDGIKLSKQTGAEALNTDRPESVWVTALTHLNQSPPAELLTESLACVIEWAIANWSVKKLSRSEFSGS